MTWPQPPPPVATIQWHGRPATQHSHNHPTCIISMAQMTHHLGLGMFFFSLLFYFTNEFIFYLLMMPWWCPTSAGASTTTTIRWCGRPVTWHSHNNQWPNAMAHHHHLYHHHHWWRGGPATWHSHNTACPLSHQPKQHVWRIIWALVCLFFSFPFILFY